MPTPSNNHILPTTDRRDFIKYSLAATSTAFGASLLSRTGQAAEPIVRNGSSHMKLSLAAYSFNRVLPKSWTRDQLSSSKMTLDDFVNFCAGLNLDGCELTAYYFPKDVTLEYLNHLKELTFRLGLDISGTAIGNNFCLPEGKERDAQLAVTRDWIDRAAILGAPVIRIFAGTVPEGDTEAAALDRCVAAINESLDYAATKGVFLGLENHGGITSTPEQLLAIVRRVKPSPWFGVNFDSGNFNTADPYADLEKIAPYTINAQIKVEMTADGKKAPTDLPRVIGILKKAGYRGYVVLEYEAEADPHEAVPKYIAQLRDIVHS
jgi:sugar phosphate isomerase/epimerase